MREIQFSKSLITYLGCVATNITDIHTKNDIIKMYKKNGN